MKLFIFRISFAKVSGAINRRECFLWSCVKTNAQRKCENIRHHINTIQKGPETRTQGTKITNQWAPVLSLIWITFVLTWVCASCPQSKFRLRKRSNKWIVKEDMRTQTGQWMNISPISRASLKECDLFLLNLTHFFVYPSDTLPCYYVWWPQTH